MLFVSRPDLEQTVVRYNVSVFILIYLSSILLKNGK